MSRIFSVQKSEGEFITHPAGTFAASLTFIGYLGQQTSYFSGEPKTNEVIGLQWETTEKGPDGRALAVTEQVNNSNSELSKLYSRLMALTGGRAAKERIDMRDLLGKGAIVTIAQVQKGDRVYANVVNVGPMPNGMPVPVPSVTPLFYDIDADAHADLGKLPARFRKLAETALGMAPAQGSGYQAQGQQQHQQQAYQQPPQTHQQAAQQAINTYHQQQAQQRPTAPPAGAAMDDDIPF
jgi:hypothetical protein